MKQSFVFLIAASSLSAFSQANAQAETTYVVEKGDYLSLIAQRLLKDGERYPELVVANSDSITDPDLIYPGQALIIPALEGSMETASAVTVPSAPLPEEPTSEPEKTPPETLEEPVERPAAPSDTQIGDRIPQPDASNRLAEAGAEANELQSQGIREIGWEELMPEGEEERLAELYQQQMAMLYSGGPIAEGSAADAMIQIGTFNTVKELNQTRVRIPGYTVPFEYGANAEISEFLLVPYYGACLHAPPPPPNQTVFAMTEEPIKLKNLAQAVWIEGTIFTQTQESELADAAYTIRVDKVETYEY